MKQLNKLSAAHRHNMILQGLFFVMMSLTLFSCNEIIESQEDVLKNSGLSLDISIDGWGGPKTRATYAAMSEGTGGNKVFGATFTSGDAIGLFAVDGTGKVVIANHKWTYDGSTWSTETPIPYETGMYSDYTYFAYYPWAASLSGAPAINSTPDISSAESFFASAITAWTPAADQSTLAAFTGSDLMMAKGTKSQPYFHEVTVNFTMAHQMALAVTQPDFTYYDINDPSFTWTISQDFQTNIPYSIGTEKYYLVKPGVETTVGAKSVTLSARQVEQLYFTNTEPGVVEYDGEKKIICLGRSKLGSSPTYSYSVSTDNGSTFGSWTSTKPSWLKIEETVSGEYITKVGAIVSRTKTTNTIVSGPTTIVASEALSGKPTLSDVDLSMVDNAGNARASRTTANCYLVHNPGTYKIPLVYGNAIVDGSTNSLSYHATETGSNIKPNLFNHANVAITDPWLKNNDATPNSAELIWQDVNGMITAVDIDGDYLTFSVAGTAAGNAVIAAKKDGVVVWSWHVWVTDETLVNVTSVDAGTHIYGVTPVNVGWVSDKEETVYQGSLCVVRATCNGVTLEFTIQQPNYVASTYSNGRNPYYQWGRKDPMIPMNLYTNYNCNTYDISGNAVTTSSNTTLPGNLYSETPIGTTIQNPLNFYYGRSGRSPYNEFKYNYWDINQNNSGDIATATVKTVYDPCPPDFCVPTSRLAYWIQNKTSTWIYASNKQGRNLTYNNYGIFFPASGSRRDATSYVTSGGNSGYSWTAIPSNSSGGVNLYFTNSTINYNNNFRSNGFPVRPVLEE